jgi:hypothetical protein
MHQKYRYIRNVNILKLLSDVKCQMSNVWCKILYIIWHVMCDMSYEIWIICDMSYEIWIICDMYTTFIVLRTTLSRSKAFSGFHHNESTWTKTLKCFCTIFRWIMIFQYSWNINNNVAMFFIYQYSWCINNDISTLSMHK